MADPTGTLGAPPISPQNDLTAVFEGGNAFANRMRALSDLREKQEAEFVNLQIGRDAKAALQESVAKRAEAEKMRADAEAVLRDAQQRASQNLQDAETRAKEMTDKAAAVLREAEAQFVARKAEIDQFEKEIKAKSSAMIIAAQNSRDEAEKLRINAEIGAAQLAEAQRLTESARLDLMEARKSLQAKIDLLKAAIEQAGG